MSTLVRKGDLFFTFALGAAANFHWEMAHSLLYRNTAGFSWWEHLWCCGLASLADGVGVVAIYAVGAALLRDPRWTRRRIPPRLGAVALLGLGGAIATETLALRLGWWVYSPAMPRVPGTSIGISPLVQFILLPLGVLFWALPGWWDYLKRRDENPDA